MITCYLEKGMSSSSRLCIQPLINTDYTITKGFTEMHTGLCVSVREVSKTLLSYMTILMTALKCADESKQ